METRDVVATRRERLRQIIKDRFKGKQTLFVEETGINAGELSGLLRARFFGEKKARSLEALLGLPSLWLDGLAEKPDANEIFGRFARVWRESGADGQKFLIGAIDAAESAFVAPAKAKANKPEKDKDHKKKQA